MSKSYDKIVCDFEKAVVQLQKDLQYLADKNSLSTKFFDKQNRIIKSLIDYHERTQTYTEQLEKESLKYQKEKYEQVQSYIERIISFEAICIIHGIIDFPMWLSKGKSILLYEAEELGKNKEMRLPILLNDKLQQLSIDERNTVMDILQKDINTAIEKLINKINKGISKSYT